MCAVCSERSLNHVAGQVFVGACSVGFQQSLLPRYQCSRLHCFCPSVSAMCRSFPLRLGHNFEVRVAF